jgi:hypothetical protein
MAGRHGRGRIVTAEFELEHLGEMYWVEVSFSRAYVDDSFDCHINGRPGTHKCGHWEPDQDSLDVESCTDGEGVEVHVDDDLMSAISERVAELDLS